MKTLCKLYKYGYLILAMAACLMLASCGKESLDYNHPDVDLFVKTTENRQIFYSKS